MTLVQLRRSGAGSGEGPDREDPGREMDFSGVLADSRGDREAPELPEWEEPAGSLEERCRRALYEVADPEYPISVVDLGLVYEVEAEEDAGRVVVTLTFTATACPCMDFIKWDVRERLLEEPDVEDVEVDVTWSPPWTADRITDRGRRMLARAGVSV